MAATWNRTILANAPLKMFSTVNDQVNGICAVVAAGTIVASDTSSPADRIVGIFRRLGYKS
ncbi:hypothetical protein [Paeniglutamicibacter gangotriensis]|uniref:hypothetical protein n=1 Tax=Paeniglutamicibacter gangotriensis TaxID=254787 RepID=UPI0013782B18|nr:hypothetical protein [Paeniglutamicibacter gangotriensis]